MSTAGAEASLVPDVTRLLYSMVIAISSASAKPAAVAATTDVASTVDASNTTEHALPSAPSAAVVSIMGVISWSGPW